ncbi:MAG: F0F1 ATP synthase subunit A [Akkermansia sp.]|nr:F0F1 ATP synthase subunit A [Akkermansia sp.]
MKYLLQKLAAIGMFTVSASAAEHAAEAEHHGLTTDAPVLWNIDIPFWPGHSLPISNSLVMFCLAVLLITLLLRLSTRNMQRIPGKLQNFVEWVFETLYNFVEGLIGKKLTAKYFWYFATVFLLILVSNYMGLIPGVGEVTYNGQPLFRGANADLNITIFLGLFYTFIWFVWVMKEQGPWHFLTHTFGPKGGLTGFLKYALLPIFFFVGIIELVSIAVRPIALAARLFGNIFAGEAILEQMSLLSWAAMLPFMALEIIVGFVQALVFLMLTAIFLKTQVGGDDEDTEAATH